MRIRVLPATLMAAALSVAPLAGQGVVLEITTTDHSGAEPSTTVGHMRFLGADVTMDVTGPEGAGRVIFRGEAREMIIVDDAQQSYMVLDEATLESMAGQMRAAMAQMERMMESLPPEQRAMVERMRSQGMGGIPGMEGAPAESPTLEFHRTGATERRGDFTADEWEVTEAGALIRRMWVADWSQIDGAEDARTALAGMIGFMDDFLAAIPRLPGQESPFARSPFASFDVADGMPVATEELGPDGTVRSETLVTAAGRADLSPGLFLPPEGYARRTLPGG